MTIVTIIVVGLVALAAGLSIVGVILGLSAGALWWVTGIYHAFKPEEPPAPVDSEWSRDQAKEAGGHDDPTRSSQ